MKHLLRDQLLASFPGTSVIGPIIMEYNTGLSGADVFAACFKPTKEQGLNGTYIIKIVEEGSVEAEKEFFKQPDVLELFRLLVPLRATSRAIDGFIAVAYEVAFHNLENTRALASILATESSLSEKEVAQQIESFCESLVNWHIKTDDIYNTGTFYNLLQLALERRRIRNIRSRLEVCLPDWPPDAPQIKFMDRIIINPLRYIQQDVWERLGQRKPYNPRYSTGYVHGDLHTGNIICLVQDVEKDTYPQAGDLGPVTGKVSSPLACPIAIDLGQMKEHGIPFSDLAYMEFDIIQQALRVSNEEHRGQWFHLLDHIMDSILPDEELRREPNKFITWDTDRALKFIHPIRRQIKRLIDSMRQKDPSLGKAPEIMWWFTTIVAGLNFARKSDSKERPQEERKAALLYAAYGLKKLHKMLEIPEEEMNRPPFVSWLSMTHPGVPASDMPMREHYLAMLCKQERDEIDVARLHIDENMVDNTSKWPLTQLFVWPHVLKQKPRHDVLPLQAHTSLSHEQAGSLKMEQQSATATPLALFNVLAEQRHLLLFGNTGMGTSTVLRYILLQIAHKRTEFVVQLPQLAESLPLFIELEHYANAVKQNTKQDITLIKPHPRLRDFIGQYLRESYPECTDFVEQQIKDGHVLFLFSDLDAIADGTIQEKVAEEIREFTRFNEKNRFIVTSRPIDFKGTSLYADYATYALLDFNETQIRLYLTQWCQLHCEHDQVQAEVGRLWQVIHKDQAIRELVTNPLFLTIFALKQSTNHISPFRRIEYFEHCKKLLLSQKGRRNDYDSYTLKKLWEAISAVAFCINELVDNDKKKVSKDDLIKQIGSLRNNENIQQNDEAIQQEIYPHIDLYIDFMRKKAGMLIRRSEEHYDFLLKPIWEYLAAEYLVSQEHIGQSSRREFIRQHWNSTHWQEVFRHAYGLILSKKAEDDAEIFVLGTFQGRGVPSLLFAVQYLVDNPNIHPILEKQIIIKFIVSYITSSFDKLRAMSSRFLLARSETPLVEEIKNTLHNEAANMQSALREDILDQNSYHKNLIRRVLGLVVYACQPMPLDDTLLRLRMMMLLCLLDIDRCDWDSTNCCVMTIKQLDEASVVKVKEAAIMLLGILGRRDTDARERLIQALNAPEWQVRSAASYALSHLAREIPDISATILHCLMNTTSEEEKEAIINTFALMGNVQPEVLDYLLVAFPMVSPSAQRALVLALGEIGRHQPDSVFDYTKVRAFLLQALTNDKYPFIRTAAATTIERLAGKEEVKQDKDVIEALESALYDVDVLVREYAEQALTCLGEPMQPNNGEWLF